MSRELEQQKLLDDYKVGTSGIYLLSPRFGKTKLAINIIKKAKAKKILWVTPSVKLRDVDIPDEFKTWKASSYLKKTTIITYHSLHKEIGKYDIIILDEVQDVTDNNTKNLFDGSLKASIIIGLTGTFPEHQEKLDIFNGLGLPILADISIDEAVDSDYIADYTINVVECNLDYSKKNIEAGNKTKRFKTTEGAQYDYLTKTVNRALFSNNEKLKQFAILNRMRAVYNSPTKEEIAEKLMLKLKGRKLIFAGSIKQAESLSKKTYHSKTDDKYLNQFLEGKIDELACVNAGGTGFTYTNVDNFIIVQANSNKKGEVTQKISRALLKQKDYVGTIWILCLLGTKDEDWVTKALGNFSADRVNYINIKNIDNYII
jgi:superfamily II DNA or RNA helicase